MNLSGIAELATVFVSVLALSIVYRQYRNDIRTTRLNLYDRRLKVYMETRNFIINLINSPEPSEKFPDLTETYFLFEEKDVYDYLHTLIMNSMKYKSLSKEIEKELDRVNTGLKPKYDEKAFEAKVKQRDTYYFKFEEDYEGLKNRFMKYLDFRKAEPEPFGFGMQSFFKWFVCKWSTFWNKLRDKNKNVPIKRQNA